MMSGIYRTALICFFLLSPAVTICADKPAGAFFLMGDGRLHIRNIHTGEEASVSLLNPDGSINEEAFGRIDRVFGFPTKEKGEHISPRLIFMLDYFSDLVAPGKVITMISGYRSHEYNSALRDAGGNVGRTSTHMDGMALDFHIREVRGRKLWQIMKSKKCCGVGYYGGKNVHLDSARPRFWEAATSKVRTGESDYNRRIYLSTDLDRYRAGGNVRLSLSSVSDFGFGIKRAVFFIDGSRGKSTVATAVIKSPEDNSCIMIEDRKSSRFLYVSIPPSLEVGRYRIRMDFCERPFGQMPMSAFSNEIELLSQAP